MGRFSQICLYLLSLIWANGVQANVEPNSLFSDHMVLQRGVAVPVWGTAEDGERITVSFNGQLQTTTAKEGKWMVQLKKMEAGGPYVLTIQGNNMVEITDVLVGEVWLCSGQSNMERQLGPRPPQKPIYDWEYEASLALYPSIRQYYVPEAFSAEKLTDRKSKWTVCDPETVRNFSAVGYFFARDLYKDLNVPIGILFSAYGGTEANHWASREALETNPVLLEVLNNYDKALHAFPAQLETFSSQYPSLYNQYLSDSAKAAYDNKPIPKKPVPPKNPAKGRLPGGLYNAMIYPLIPYAIKGVCWYQGENDNGKADIYASTLTTLINGWRNDWREGDFPFLIVQIAPHKDMRPEIRNAQLQVVKNTKETALIVTTDCGDSADIHPAFKQPVGQRLALAARAVAYGEKIEYSGPMIRSATIVDGNIELKFTHTADGLKTSEGPLTGFSIAGPDGKFFPANATISGKKVVLSHPSVHNPIHIRYGWSNVPHVNLVNSEGLPASPFRIDF